MRVDLEAEADLLENRVGLVTPRLTRLHVGLVLELAEVHELGDRRTSVRGDLDQVEVGVLGELQGDCRGDNADLLSARTDEPDLGDADPVVDARLADGDAPRNRRWTAGNEERPPP
ncbi:hypothetical protein GCM10007967_06430 [Xylanimonas ulmi]